MDIKRQPDETLDDFKLRICANKDVLGITWDEVKDILNKESQENFGESVYRKWFHQFSAGMEYANEKRAKENGSYSELQEQIKELEIAKIQMQDQKREYRKYLRHKGRLDHLLQTMIDSIKDDLETKKPLEWVKPIRKKDGTGSLVLLLSDLHRGMVTDNHWNKFNEEVFEERLNQTLQELKDYQEITQAETLHIMQLGDLVEGSLHRLTKIGETETAVEQTQRVAEALSEFTHVLSGEFGEIHFHSVKGNHDRTSSRKEEEIKTESFHEFVPWYMKARLNKHENVIFHENEVDDEIIVAEVEGATIYGVHGHLDSINSKVVADLTLMIGKKPDIVVAGHIHHNYENEVHGVDIIVNGGFAGTNDYAKDKRLTSKAHQKLLWLNDGKRKATFYIQY